MDKKCGLMYFSLTRYASENPDPTNACQVLQDPTSALTSGI